MSNQLQGIAEKIALFSKVLHLHAVMMTTLGEFFAHEIQSFHPVISYLGKLQTQSLICWSILDSQGYLISLNQWMNSAR